MLYERWTTAEEGAAEWCQTHRIPCTVEVEGFKSCSTRKELKAEAVKIFKFICFENVYNLVEIQRIFFLW